MPVQLVTAAEAASYRKFADFFREKWGRLDPAMIALKREGLPGKQERIVFDMRMSPFDRQHFDLLSKWVGPADKLRLSPIAGDMAALELVLRDQRLFGGLRDVGSPMDVLGGGIGNLWQRFRNMLVGYVGSYGKLGLLKVLDLTIPAAPDAAGYASNRLGLWRRQFDRFTVYSFQPDLLASVTQQLRFEETKQLRAGAFARGRCRTGKHNAVAQQSRILSHAQDGPGQYPPDARLGPAVARSAGELQGGGRVSHGGQAGLPIGRPVRTSQNARRPQPLDCRRTGRRRRAHWTRADSPARIRSAAAELVSRARRRRHDDRQFALRPRANNHATAEIKRPNARQFRTISADYADFRRLRRATNEC